MKHYILKTIHPLHVLISLICNLLSSCGGEILSLSSRDILPTHSSISCRTLSGAETKITVDLEHMTVRDCYVAVTTSKTD